MIQMDRGIGEIIRISDDTWVKVVSIKGNQVKLSIVAPPEVPIVRAELYKPEK